MIVGFGLGLFVLTDLPPHKIRKAPKPENQQENHGKAGKKNKSEKLKKKWCTAYKKKKENKEKKAATTTGSLMLAIYHVCT